MDVKMPLMDGISAAEIIDEKPDRAGGAADSFFSAGVGGARC
jgi:CheY-like chemotaxis protein